MGLLMANQGSSCVIHAPASPGGPLRQGLLGPAPGTPDSAQDTGDGTRAQSWGKEPGSDTWRVCDKRHKRSMRVKDKGVIVSAGGVQGCSPEKVVQAKF